VALTPVHSPLAREIPAVVPLVSSVRTADSELKTIQIGTFPLESAGKKKSNGQVRENALLEAPHSSGTSSGKSGRRPKDARHLTRGGRRQAGPVHLESDAGTALWPCGGRGRHDLRQPPRHGQPVIW
jgi:hypothetical protein